jgi:hypothetical protein
VVAARGRDWSFMYAVCGHAGSPRQWQPPYLIEERLEFLTPAQGEVLKSFVRYMAGPAGPWSD